MVGEGVVKTTAFDDRDIQEGIKYHGVLGNPPKKVWFRDYLFRNGAVVLEDVFMEESKGKSYAERVIIYNIPLMFWPYEGEKNAEEKAC